MAYKQIFVIVVLVALASLVASQSSGGACGANTVPNSIYNCGTACPKNCKNQNTDINCIDLCITDGCSCAKGYIRCTDSQSECIRPSQCPS